MGTLASSKDPDEMSLSGSTLFSKAKNGLQRKKYNIYLETITCDPFQHGKYLVILSYIYTGGLQK